MISSSTDKKLVTVNIPIGNTTPLTASATATKFTVKLYNFKNLQSTKLTPRTPDNPTLYSAALLGGTYSTNSVGDCPNSYFTDFPVDRCVLGLFNNYDTTTVPLPSVPTPPEPNVALPIFAS